MEVEKEWPFGGHSSVQVEKGGSVNSLLTIDNNTELYIWVALVVKNLPANAGDVREAGSIPGWGRSPGGGNGNPLLYSCLENPIDRGAWLATVQSVINSQTQLKRLSTQDSRSFSSITRKKNVLLHMVTDVN